MYQYKYPHPAVTTDIVIFTIKESSLNLLLIKRGEEPYKNEWALPGGFIQMDETLDDCAKRELEEETGVSNVYLEQLYTFGAVNRDPRERVISVAYFALISSEKLSIQADTDASDAQWFDIKNLPDLAFDHIEIVTNALERLKSKLNYSTIAFQFLPNEFTLTEAQEVYEIISSEEIDKRNFRKSILSMDVLKETDHVKSEGAHRPAKLFKLKQPTKVKVIK